MAQNYFSVDCVLVPASLMWFILDGWLWVSCVQLGGDLTPTIIGLIVVVCSVVAMYSCIEIKSMTILTFVSHFLLFIFSIVQVLGLLVLATFFGHLDTWLLVPLSAVNFFAYGVISHAAWKGTRKHS